MYTIITISIISPNREKIYVEREREKQQLSSVVLEFLFFSFFSFFFNNYNSNILYVLFLLTFFLSLLLYLFHENERESFISYRFIEIHVEIIAIGDLTLSSLRNVAKFDTNTLILRVI